MIDPYTTLGNIGETTMNTGAIMEKVTIRKLTEEEKQKIIFVLNDLLSDDIPEEPTEYDILMKQKLEEFKAFYLKDNELSQIEALMEECDAYIKREGFAGIGFVMAYDMWINESLVWPTGPNPKWKEWEKLKKKKVKRIAHDE